MEDIVAVSEHIDKSYGDKIQKFYRFDNGYGVSTIRHKIPINTMSGLPSNTASILGRTYFSYTHSDDVWESIEIEWKGIGNFDFELVGYPTGYIKEGKDLQKFLRKVKRKYDKLYLFDKYSKKWSDMLDGKNVQ